MTEPLGGRYGQNVPRLSLGALAAVVVVSSLPSAGCGGIWYTARINSVEGKVEQAREIGAETLAPYEYFGAKENLLKAEEEASRAEYSDAITLLDKAEELALKAIGRVGAARKEKAK